MALNSLTAVYLVLLAPMDEREKNFDLIDAE